MAAESGLTETQTDPDLRSQNIRERRKEQGLCASIHTIHWLHGTDTFFCMRSEGHPLTDEYPHRHYPPGGGSVAWKDSV